MNSQNTIRPAPGPNKAPAGCVTPPPAGRLCTVCGRIIDGWDGITSTHPGCGEGDQVATSRWGGAGERPKPVGHDHPTRVLLVDMIRRYSAESPRSQQTTIGPSELGSGCDRCVAMRMAGCRTVNRFVDPWPSIEGTANHRWLEGMLHDDNRRLGRNRWLVETTVHIDPLVTGHCDVYDTDTCRVIDWKNPRAEKLRKLREQIENGSIEGYHRQTQLYGLGMLRAGYRVDKVALLLLPRGGRLKDAAYVEWDFNPAIAHEAIARLYTIGATVLELQEAHKTADIWGMIPHDPTALCGWCDYYSPRQVKASADGCPGQ